MCLKYFKGLLNQITQVEHFTLSIMDLVSKVKVPCFVLVEDGKDLAVVGNEGLSNCIGAENKCLKYFQCYLNDLRVSGI